MDKKDTILFSFSTSIYPWLVVGCGMLFYCYNYFLRIAPSVMQPELAATFHIDASQLGVLAAFYYYAYTPMQIPAGLLYDKYGARFVLALSALTAVIGLGIFIQAQNYYLAATGRFFIGLGCAFAYIGTLKLGALWLPANRFAMVAGITTALGMAAGALSQKYLNYFIETIGYHTALELSLLIGIILSLLIICIVRSQPKQAISGASSEMSHPLTLRQVWIALKIIFCNKQMWIIGLIGCLLYLPSSIFLDLWGVPYLNTVYDLPTAEAVNMLNFTFYGWIISGPLIGLFSDKTKRRKLPLLICTLLVTFIAYLIFYTKNLTSYELYILFFSLGVFTGAHPLCFALSKESAPTAITGTAIAVTNMFIMAGGAAGQPFVGALLDGHTNSIIRDINGLLIYSASDFTFALSIVPIGGAFATLLALFLKETYCEPQASLEDEEKLEHSMVEV